MAIETPSLVIQHPRIAVSEYECMDSSVVKAVNSHSIDLHNKSMAKIQSLVLLGILVYKYDISEDNCQEEL